MGMWKKEMERMTQQTKTKRKGKVTGEKQKSSERKRRYEWKQVKKWESKQLRAKREI